ncbi:hypothetical protein KSS87_012497 [Heliosperma pusillum]|nr:hypothetical protein KSS87_012497 [Heliosperma pusillum]
MASGGALSPLPKILLAKPGLIAGGGSGGGKLIRGGDDETNAASIRSHFTVVGVIGPPGVGKSTILNLIYGFDPTSPGMLPPFGIQSEETRANARHCTTGMEPRISSERFILLDTQPLFSPSVLAEMTRPDGSSTVPILTGETVSSELAHEILGIQVDLLKHGIPDPSSVSLQSHGSNLGSEKDSKDKLQEVGEEYITTPIFVHTKLREEDTSPQITDKMEKVLAQYFRSSSFVRAKSKSCASEGDSKKLDLFVVPRRTDHSLESLHESYDSAMWKIRDYVLSMTRPSFSRTVSEREWLKNTAKIWDLVKHSSIIAEYCRMLQNSVVISESSSEDSFVAVWVSEAVRCCHLESLSDDSFVAVWVSEAVRCCHYELVVLVAY